MNPVWSDFFFTCFKCERLLQEPDSEEQKAPITIDLAGLAKQCRESNNTLIPSLVDMAKAEALASIGEKEKALKLVDQHLSKYTTNTR